jgi:hypothetical protein
MVQLSDGKWSKEVLMTVIVAIADRIDERRAERSARHVRRADSRPQDFCPISRSSKASNLFAFVGTLRELIE